MSDANVAIVREAFAAWRPNDAAAFAEHLDPEFEYHVTYGVERGVYRGWRATVDAFDRWQDVFSAYDWEPTGFIDGGDHHVIVPFSEQGTGQASNVRVAQERAFLCTMRDAKILRITEYESTADALDAAPPAA